jgi:hypothetical protein
MATRYKKDPSSAGDDVRRVQCLGADARTPGGGVAVRADASWKRDEGETATRMNPPAREAFSSTAAFQPIDQDIRTKENFK